MLLSMIVFQGVLLGEIVKNLSKMAIPDPKQRLKMMMLSAVSSLTLVLRVQEFSLSALDIQSYFNIFFPRFNKLTCSLLVLSA